MMLRQGGGPTLTRDLYAAPRAACARHAHLRDADQAGQGRGSLASCTRHSPRWLPWPHPTASGPSGRPRPGLAARGGPIGPEPPGAAVDVGSPSWWWSRRGAAWLRGDGRGGRGGAWPAATGDRSPRPFAGRARAGVAGTDGRRASPTARQAAPVGLTGASTRLVARVRVGAHRCPAFGAGQRRHASAGRRARRSRRRGPGPDWLSALARLSRRAGSGGSVPGVRRRWAPRRRPGSASCSP